MDIKNSSSEEPQSAATIKKPYQKPGFRFEQVFVTSALSCGKVVQSDNNCKGLNASAS
jgi:hypothetical protein